MIGIEPASPLRTRSARDPRPWAGWRVITPGYLRAVGLPLLRGRTFDDTDKQVWAERGQPPPTHRTVILSSALTKLPFPNQDPVFAFPQLGVQTGL
jgi:hypothetical protein